MQPDRPSSSSPPSQSAAAPAKASGAGRSVCADSTIEVAKGQDVAVRMYGRKKAGQASPVVVHFHGGAFMSGNLDNGCTVASLLEGAGAVVVSVAYPLTPFPQPVDTGYDVLKWVHRNRTKLGGQGSQVYLAGEEAGGNLAAAVALMARDQSHPPLAGQILLSPMLDPCVGTASLREATGDATGCKWTEGWRNFLRCPRDAEHPYAVPAGAHRLAGLPPTLVLVGDTDPMHDEALAYAARLESAGLQVTRRVFSKTAQWPDALLQTGEHECPCAAGAQEQFRQFFEATRCPVPS
ncbi:alpha/beta hydrolase [Acidovorax sp. FJL06]|uniref:alpha/beta hydrolase n=1 Tax=Acidovorax sp. FJL06 TaxID=2153365 RepID=UPI000F57292F|nr:alpha/beta hydrolase [Acidovorax sp. FJL06]RQO82841.1 alpha/beta hydrolase [Acidovorax sp. FJL06]